MSYFDDASLVMIPSGTKTSKVYSVKPIDGTGDLAFTRSNDTATRVASNGLIEKVRTNLILQSEAFNTTWTQNAAPTITANTTVAPDGTTTADTIAATGTSSGVYQTPVASIGGEYSFSVYLKNITSATNIEIGCDSNPANATLRFNAVTGAIVSTGAGITGSSVTNAGNGWYRVQGTYISTGASNTFLIYGQTGMTFSAWGAQFETGVTTAYIATTTAAVSVGPVANVPRLDYLNSSCPKLLLEPQRTNLVTFSEQLDNADWGGAGTTITANQAVSPDGYTNADLAVNAASSNYIFQGIVGSISGTFTASIFAKKGTQSSFAFGMVSAGFGSGMGVKFNFDTQTFSTPTNYANFTSISASYQSYGNGWYRLNLTGTTATSTAYFFVLGSLLESFAVNAYVWGAHLEAGTYATSYIPTLAASATRGADSASKTGISSLIGQTQGTIFAEINVAKLLGIQSRYILVISDNTANNRIYIAFSGSSSNILRARIFSGGVQQASIDTGTISSLGTYKLALAYNNNDAVLYMNGAQIGTDTSVTIPACSQLNVCTNQAGASPFDDGINQALLFKTRLTNAQLAELTTI